MIKGGGGHKSSWIRPTTRLALYLRDGFACVYCHVSAFAAPISLDHVKPRVNGGTNDPTNLVTCCKVCNESRRALGDAAFARRLGLTASELRTRQASQAGAPLTAHLREQARRLRATRPAWLLSVWSLAANPGRNAAPVEILEEVPF